MRSFSQVTIVPPQIAPGNNPTIIQLMYGILSNITVKEYDVYIQLVCTNKGQPVADVKSKTFHLPFSNTIINAQNAENLLYPVKVKYADNKYFKYGIETSTVPPGTYIICITVINAVDEAILGNNCFSFTVENFTSVNLLTPMNNSESKNLYPIFTWSKVTGSSSTFSDDIYYSLKIVEIIDGQSAVIAMQSNPAVFKEDEISFNLFQYPVNAQPLKPCMEYAWQIEAFQGNGVNKKSLIKSEIWSFRVECEKEIHWTPNGESQHEESKKKSKKPTVSHHAYYSLNTEYSMDMVDVSDTLFLQFDNNYSSGSNQLSYRIINLTNYKTSSETKLNLATNQGINRIELPIQNAGVAIGESGTLTLYDNNKYYYLNFKRSTNNVNKDGKK